MQQMFEPEGHSKTTESVDDAELAQFCEALMERELELQEQRHRFEDERKQWEDEKRRQMRELQTEAELLRTAWSELETEGRKIPGVGQPHGTGDNAPAVSDESHCPVGRQEDASYNQRPATSAQADPTREEAVQRFHQVRRELSKRLK